MADSVSVCYCVPFADAFGVPYLPETNVFPVYGVPLVLAVGPDPHFGALRDANSEPE